MSWAEHGEVLAEHHPIRDHNAAQRLSSDVGDASQVGPLLDQINSPVASFIADGAYDQDGVYAEIAARHPEACVIVPPRRNAVPSDTADMAPTKRD
jgi:hypothetical protein